MNARQLQRRHLRRAALVSTEFRKTMNGLGISAVNFGRQKMTSEIYAIPEDVSPRTGRKKWQRTGALRRSERHEVRSPYTVAIVNDRRYAEPRHEAGKRGRRRINPLRESHWRDEMIKVFRPILLDASRATVQAILKKGQV